MNALALAMYLSLAEMPSTSCESLVRQLGHEDYIKREAASEKLLSMGFCAEVMEARNHPDPEIASRCRRLSEGMVEREIDSYGKLPWLDSFWMKPDGVYAGGWDFCEDGSRCRLYSHYLRMPSEGGLDWQSYRDATRYLLRDWLRDGMPRPMIRVVLERMRANDEIWRKKQREVVPPPMEVP